MKYTDSYQVNSEITQLTKYTSNRIGGIIQTRNLTNSRFIQNSFIGIDYTIDNPLFLLKEGVSLNARHIGEFILELEELKNTLEATDLASKMSKD